MSADVNSDQLLRASGRVHLQDHDLALRQGLGVLEWNGAQVDAINHALQKELKAAPRYDQAREHIEHMHSENGRLLSELAHLRGELLATRRMMRVRLEAPPIGAACLEL